MRAHTLIWAIILGMVFFGEMPRAWMLTGMDLVVATGATPSTVSGR